MASEITTMLWLGKKPGINVTMKRNNTDMHTAKSMIMAIDMQVGAVGFTPMAVVEIEISASLPTLTLIRPNDEPYQRALVLVRIHTRPLGLVEIATPGGTLDVASLAAAIWDAFPTEINAHLAADLLPVVSHLDPAGLPFSANPACLVERDVLLADAPLASVVICTRERPDSLARCLDACLGLDYPHYELVVVDNAPTTDTTARLIADRYTGGRVRYVCEPHAGLGWARNRGLHEARGEIVAFTDDDVVVDRHWLTELVRGFQADDDVACVTGSVLPAELETQEQIWCEERGSLNKGFARRIFDLDIYRADGPLYPYRSSIFGTGANGAFSTAVLRTLGGFDVALGTGTPSRGGEDLDIFFRVIDAGYRLVYEPAALLWHKHHATYEALRRQSYGYGVGFTAYLTKCAVTSPRHGLRLLANIPAGLAFAMDRMRRHADNTMPSYPRELARLEMRGQLEGPFRYAQSRRATRKVGKRG
jgi:GT2 family glycosyltransferase